MNTIMLARFVGREMCDIRCAMLVKRESDVMFVRKELDIFRNPMRRCDITFSQPSRYVGISPIEMYVWLARFDWSCESYRRMWSSSLVFILYMNRKHYRRINHAHASTYYIPIIIIIIIVTHMRVLHIGIVCSSHLIWSKRRECVGQKHARWLLDKCVTAWRVRLSDLLMEHIRTTEEETKTNLAIKTRSNRHIQILWMLESCDSCRRSVWASALLGRCLGNDGNNELCEVNMYSKNTICENK